VAESQTTATRAEKKLLTRQKLLEATIEIIAAEGLDGVTMAKVAERTGLSRGICNYHFDTKEQLMLEAFRVLYREYQEAWQNALADLTIPPERRLARLVETLLSPPIADLKKLAVWLAFWGVTPHRRTYLELCTEGDRAYEAAVEDLLRQLAPGAESVKGMKMRAIAVALTSMIDGAHLQFLIAPDRISAAESISACLAYLSSFFPQFKGRIGAQKEHHRLVATCAAGHTATSA
jgi:TetR/AcrR family transcriptional repressor of bet genes